MAILGVIVTGVGASTLRPPILPIHVGHFLHVLSNHRPLHLLRLSLLAEQFVLLPDQGLFFADLVSHVLHLLLHISHLLDYLPVLVLLSL